MILSSVLFLLGLGLVAALLLAVASRLLYVYEDPRIAKVEGALLGANCGGCGYPGCHAAAEAVVAGKAGPDVCVAGGASIATNVAAVMGVEMLVQEPRVADHYCFGGQRAENKYIYEGARDCRAQAMLHGGKLVCNVGCLGCGTCVDNCPFDALSMSPMGVPVVDPDKCRACGKCAEVCPKGVISVFDNTRRMLHMNKTYECLAPCRQICPAQINIPKYIEHIKNGEYEAAICTLRERNPLILTCGRVCPAPCESYCRRALVDDPVGINYLKRFVADWEMENDLRVPIQLAPDTGRKVAVIGGGPAGLSCAYFLRRLGHAATIFESMPALGGQLRYGIPEYRLPKKVLDWEIEGITTAIGVEVKTEVQFGKDVTLDGLRDQGFDAVFLGMGAWRNYNLRIENEEARGVIGGTEYLTRAGLGVQLGLARRVIVVGGGNTAIDAARTARRRNAEVTIMYRRTRREMPANAVEIDAAEEEGVRFLFLAAPKRVVSDASGHVTGLEYIRMELGEPDASGRRKPLPVEDSETVEPCNQLITAIGQFPDTSYLEDYAAHIGDEWACKITPRKTLAVNEETMQTAIPHVFAAGDYVTGPALAVTAIGGGRRAARGIHYFLAAKDAPDSIRAPKQPLPETLFSELHGVGKKARTKQPELCVEDRACNFLEVEHAISEDQARTEAGRCLRCGSTCYDKDLLEEMPEELRVRLNGGRPLV